MLHLSMFFLYSGIAWLPEYYAWMLGVDALRRIDPSYTKREGILLPSLFYIFIKPKKKEKRSGGSTKAATKDTEEEVEAEEAAFAENGQ